MMKKIAIAIILVIMMASSFTFAYSSVQTTLEIGPGGNNGKGAVISIASLATSFLKYGTYSTGSTIGFSDPSWEPVNMTAGEISPGDIYHLDTRGNDRNVEVTLFLLNPESLAKNYSYIMMNVNVYRKGADFIKPGELYAGINDWQPAISSDGTVIEQAYLSLSNGEVPFILPGNSEYDITIDGGAFYCNSTSSLFGGNLSPKFYLNVKTISE